MKDLSKTTPALIEQSESERKGADDALKDSETKLHAIFNTVGAGILIIDRDTQIIIEANQTAIEMTGLSKERLIGKICHSLVCPAEVGKCPVKDLGQGIDNSERKLLHSDGHPRDILKTVYPITIKGRDCYLESFIDISDRKRAEEELKASNDFMTAVLDNLSDLLLVIDPVNYTILGTNKTFTNSYGLNKDKIIGKYCYELTHNLSDPCSPPNHICPLAEALKTGKTSTVEHIHHDSTGRKLYVEVSAIPIINKGGEVHQIISLSRNITERKQMEEALQKTNLNLSAIIDNLPFLAWLKDSEGRFIVVNEPFARSCGLFSANDLVGKTDLDVWPKELAEAYRTDDFEVMRTRQKKAVEELIVDQGVQKWFETYKAPLYNVDGDVIGTTGFARDITDRKKTEELQHDLKSLRKVINAAVQVMVTAVETRDPYTAGHQVRSADLARAIATEMGLPKDKIDAIRIAGSIHDIGKLSVPAEILSKPMKLSEIEFSLIKEHANKGFEMLKDVESPWPLAEIVYQHHERMNGSGYPRNLQGEEILIEARILAVADLVEAMASHRPYRPALGLDAALGEIEKNKGTLYDASVVNACLKLFREKGFQLQER